MLPGHYAKPPNQTKEAGRHSSFLEEIMFILRPEILAGLEGTRWITECREGDWGREKSRREGQERGIQLL